MIREHAVSVNGRELCVVEAGDGRGPLILFHNGTPGSRLAWRGWIDDAEARGARFVGYDRPGYGRSDPQPGRSVADAAGDVAAIADALGAERLVVWGLSGGGPHALACAALLPERVAAVATLASVAPYPAEGLNWLDGMGEDNIEEFGLALEGREPLEPFLRTQTEQLLSLPPEELASAFRSLVSPADAAVLTGEYAEYLQKAMGEGIGERLDGWLDDDLAFTKPWGFDVEDIRVPVQLWQGAQDRFVPFAHGKWLAERIPRVDAHLSEEDGHLTLQLARVGDVHAWLLEHMGEPSVS